MSMCCLLAYLDSASPLKALYIPGMPRVGMSIDHQDNAPQTCSWVSLIHEAS